MNYMSRVVFHPCHYIIVKTQKIKVSEFEMYPSIVEVYKHFIETMIASGSLQHILI